MIEIGNRIYFVDMGTQAIEDLRRYGKEVEAVKGIFVTHMHGDHANGILSFVDLCNWFFTGAEPKIFLPTEEGVEAVKGWINALDKHTWRGIDIDVTKEGVFYDDGFLKVTAVRTQHTRMSYCYFIEAEGKKILFTGDLRSPSIDYPKEAFGKRLDMVVCESAHFSPLEYIPVFEKSDIKKVFINHIQPRKLPIAQQLIEELNGRIDASIATDETVVEL